jgi:cytosine/adenosine deaminase-related metal-dependent hydrolase
MADPKDNYFIKKAFFDHMLRHGFTRAHVEAYGEYFDFFLARLGDAKLMDLPPHEVYQRAMAPVEELDGEEVVEAYLVLMERFMGYWAERYEAMHPEDEAAELPEKED